MEGYVVLFGSWHHDDSDDAKSCAIALWMEPWYKRNNSFAVSSTVVLKDGHNSAGKLNQ